MNPRLLFGVTIAILVAALAFILSGSMDRGDGDGAGQAVRSDPASGGEARHGAAGDTRGGAGSGAGSGARSGGGRGGEGRRGGARESLVITRAVGSGVSGDRLVALGDGEAVASVDVTPRDSGVLDAVLVASGDTVAPGAVLARLDEGAERIRRDIAARAVVDATTTRDRFARLMRSQVGAQADLDEAGNALARAELSLAEAELQLAQRRVRAPIAGRVGLVRVQPGDRVDTGTTIATIDDRSTLRVEFRVPERFANRVDVGQAIEATSFAAPGQALTGTITAIGSRVSADSRTLPVQAAIDNADDRLRPGMSFQVTLAFVGETLPSIDPLALQWDSKGSFVWAVRDGAAERVPARIVQRNPETVLVRGELQAGDEVVTEGVLSLRPGAAVRVAGARARPDPQGTSAEGAGS